MSERSTRQTPQIGDLPIDMTPDDEAAFKKLALGRVDAVYSNRDVGYDLIAKLGLKNIRCFGPHRTLDYYISFGQQSTDKAIVDRFFGTFRDLHKQGIIKDILATYKMEPAQLD